MSTTVPLFLIFVVGIHLTSPSHQTNTKPPVQGICGCNGRDGRDGLNGIPGRDGPKGSKGIKGDKGDQGLPGKQGKCNQTLVDNIVKNLTAQLENITRLLNKEMSKWNVKFSKLKNYDACSLTKPRALGMNSYAIKDAQLSASSVYMHNTLSYGAHRARLNYKDWRGWAAQTLDTNQWLQIIFGRPTIVTGVATQGYRNLKEYVKTYQLAFSTDGNNWMLYKENGVAAKNFTGNTDGSTVVKHLLMYPIQTLYLHEVIPEDLEYSHIHENGSLRLLNA